MQAALYISQHGQLNFSEFSYYEFTRGLKAVGAMAQLARFEQFCQSHHLFPFSHSAAIIAADIGSDLKKRGSLMGEVDILIASIALAEGLAVATHNLAHFNRISGLQVVDWTV